VGQFFASYYFCLLFSHAGCSSVGYLRRRREQQLKKETKKSEDSFFSIKDLAVDNIWVSDAARTADSHWRVQLDAFARPVASSSTIFCSGRQM
jgi:hypothetical protein